MKKYIYISLVILFTVLIFGHIQAATISNTAIKGMSVSVLSNNTFPNISSIACVPGSLSLPEITDNKSSTSTKIVQGALLKWGYKIDDKEIKFGIYGNSTKKAVSQFQKKNKIKVTGNIDNATKSLMVSKSDCKSLLKTPDSIYSKEATKTIANKLSPVTKKTVNSKSAVTAPVKALSAASKIVRSQDSIFLNDLYLIDTSGKREYKYGVSSGPGDNRDGSGTYTYEALDNSKDPVYKISSVLGDSYTDMYFGDFLYKTYNFKYQGKLDGSGVGSVDVDYCTYNDMYEYICGSYSEQAGLPPPNLETYGMLSLPNYTWRSNGHVDMEVTGAWKGTLSDTHESHVSLITTDTPQKVRQMDFELSNISAGMTAVSKNMEKREISCAELSVGGKPPQVDPNDNKFCIGKVKA